MIREWLPHLLVGIFALLLAVTGAIYLAMSPADQEAVENQWSDWLTPGWDEPNESENTTTVTVAKLPPIEMIVWATVAFSALGGFYMAAAMAGYVHRTEA